MSLRWKLLRFLSVNTLLSPTPADSIDYESSLFPSLTTSSTSNSLPSNPNAHEDPSVVLARFAAAADRAVHAHNAHAIYAFALPRAVVQLYNIPSLNLFSPSSVNTASSTTSSAEPSAGTNASTPEAERFPCQVSFSAHENAVIAVRVIPTDDPLPLVITLGLDHSGGSLKIWKLQSPPPLPSSIPEPSSQSKLLDISGAGAKDGIGKPKPQSKAMNAEDLVECIAVYRFQGDARPTALAVNASLTRIAVGFVDGVVVILSGDVLQERATRIRIAPAPGEMIEPKPIVFLEYAGTLLYGVSEVSIVVIFPPNSSSIPHSTSTSSTSQHQQKITIRRSVLDNLGAKDHNVCCVLPSTQELVVAKPEALYFFNRDGRGQCLGFATDGKRPLITAVGHYLVHSTGHGSITAYDVSNKLIAYRGKGIATCAFASPPEAKGGKALAISMTDGAVLKLSELPLDDRVNMLLKRGLYLPAVRLAKAETASSPTIRRSGSTISGADNDKMRSTLLKQGSENNNSSGNEVVVKALRQYAEYLMSKNRYDEAAEQLIETIGRQNSHSSKSMFQSNGESVEPSWVITRLVEQSGLRSGLRMYLEALHAAGQAAFVHTKVLITCYRHDRARGAILGNSSGDKTADEYVINVFSDVDWNETQVDAAISLCRDAGLYRVAERVARRRGRYVQLARTLVEDLHDPDSVIDLLNETLANDDEQALAVVSACAPKLLRLCPMDFVHYLTDAVCKGTATNLKPNPASGGDINSGPTASRADKDVMSSSGANKVSGRVGTHSAPILRLDELLPLFIDCPQWRATLLLQTLSRPGGLSASEAPKAWILLFESLVCMDLGERIHANRKQRRKAQSRSNGGAVDGKMKKKPGRKALKILHNRWSVIDLRGALDIAEQYGHSPCLEYLYEHLRMYRELGISLRLSRNYDGLLRACRRHGEREPNLWIDALRLFVPVAARDCEENSGDEMSSTKGSGESGMSSTRNPADRKLTEYKDKQQENGDVFDDVNEGDSEASLVSSRRNSTRDDSDDKYTFGFDDFDVFSIGDGDESIINLGDDNEDGDSSGLVDDKYSFMADGDDDQETDALRIRSSLRRGAGRKGVIRAQEVVDEAMQAIERSGILSSLEIIEVAVDACGGGSWGVVREFFERSCSTLRRDAIATEHSAAMLEAECEELEKESRRLRDETIVMKAKVCAVCGDPLSLPAIHFLCGCSYHVGCLSVSSSTRKDNPYFDDELQQDQVQEDEILEECVKCAPEVDAALSMKKALIQRNERHDEFFATLRSARDGFATIIEFLERSPFLK